MTHTIEEDLQNAIRSKERKILSCKDAHEISGELSMVPENVGSALDVMDVEIVECQLGLFGYLPEKNILNKNEDVSSELEELIKKNSKNGKMTCRDAWDIASQNEMSRLAFAHKFESMGIKIIDCQLGAFGEKKKK